MPIYIPPPLLGEGIYISIGKGKIIIIIYVYAGAYKDWDQNNYFLISRIETYSYFMIS